MVPVTLEIIVHNANYLNYRYNFNFGDLTASSGAVRKVQGYETFALSELVKIFPEEQIKTDRKDVPRIQYSVNGKKKYHFPDIFLPPENKIVEVKSTWTYKCKADNVLLKKQYAEKQGFIYEIWCYDSKGNRVEITELPSDRITHE